ncbi:MAG: LamG-like jellyroll fold domain-containing protein, partial [Clostridia bacterium]
QFSEVNIKSGSIKSGDLVIKDASGKGNDLKMRTYGTNYADTVSFSDESIDGKSGSIFLNGLIGGVDFVTIDSAPINKNSFVNGYTIEIIYKMPSDWTTADRWTSLLSRLGSTTAIDTENESVTTVVHVSNCKEIQFIPANRYNQSTLTSNVWSVAMDKAENWYSIVITGDNTGIRTFVNGCESFRDAVTSSMQGLYADPNDGRFRIGARILSSGFPYRFTRGFIQEIRISDKALSKDEWLVPNPEQLVGDYGDNSAFEETKKDRYNMVFVPDTQNATKFRGDVMDIAMDWLIENKDYANIETVVSLGDNVEDFWETPQWEQISKNYASLAESGIKTIVPAGNHDTDYGRNYWYYNKYFGPGSDFDNLASDYIISYSPSGSGAVADISAGSFPYKLVYIDMYQLESGGDMAWLEQTLLKYSDCPIVIVMHDIQNCSDTAPNETKLSAKGAILWNNVKKYDNVFLMVGGHSHGYGVLELENDYGNKVYSVLADYQFSYNGGNALCKFAEFDENEGKIRISTFSPYAATLKDEERSFFDVNFMTGKGHYDEIDIDFKERFGNFKTYKAVGENIMTNPSFEDDYGNFSLEGWLSAKTNEQFGSPYTTNHGYAVSATERIFNGVSTKASTTIPDGNWAFATNWHDGKDGLCSLKRYVPVESGKTYIVSYKVKHKYGADGGYLVTSLVANEGDDENSETASSAGYIGTEWTTVTKTFTATDDTDYVLFWFRWLGEGGNTGDGPYWYFDDFSICEAEETYVTYTMNARAEKVGEKINVTFDYNEKANKNFIVVGFDDEGKLISVASTDVGEATLDGEEITKVKVFAWDSLNAITPLTTVKTVTIE